MYPPKLKKGDEIRIITPSRSMSIISEDIQKIAQKRLENLGFTVTFGKNINESDEFASSSIQSRINDLHEAFKDKNVKAILTVIGGFNSNQLLSYINWDIIKNNPKILSGYSDTTALQNAIFKKTGLITYSGPSFSMFGMKKGFEYIQEHFKKCLINENPFEIKSSSEWSDDSWYKDQENRKFTKNQGPFVINNGKAKGTIIGANLCTFNLLHGTEYLPDFKDSILFIEDCVEGQEEFVVNFDRDLQSIIHQSNFKDIKAIVIGRFEHDSKMTKEILTKIIKTKKELDNIPVIANVDFGHTNPITTFPIGGEVEINADNDNIKIVINKH
ncbi:LD-carboxypeptidase [Candidatus Pacearchaeota archaeon]|nr:LD-carboxypeptidase [Candidatus Pacearchaeota archaeon]